MENTSHDLNFAQKICTNILLWASQHNRRNFLHHLGKQREKRGQHVAKVKRKLSARRGAHLSRFALTKLSRPLAKIPKKLRLFCRLAQGKILICFSEQIISTGKYL